MNIDDIGEFTIYNAQKIKDYFLQVLKEDRDIIMDMSTIEKIDMVGIQLLISLVKSAKELSKNIKFINLTSEVSEQIKICNCDSVLGICND